jgi:hypothetical protein
MSGSGRPIPGFISRQVSPLAATFVELVTCYPDTIERLQTLPRRVSRHSGKTRT